jgi:hypothetical protein
VTRLRLILAGLAASAMAVVAGLAAPTAAQADPPVAEAYALVSSAGDVQIGYTDINGVPVVICRKCFHWWENQGIYEYDAAQQNAFHRYLLGGLYNLGKARTLTDPVQVRQHREAAMASFTNAARTAGTATLSVGRVGYYDSGKGVTVPQATPWLAAGAGHLLRGIGYLQRSQDPAEANPVGWIRLAHDEFDKGYDCLDRKES